jgi:hypothetical protein
MMVAFYVFNFPPAARIEKRTLKLLAIHLLVRTRMAEHRMSHPCLFCPNKASSCFLNHNIQNTTAASAGLTSKKHVMHFRNH